MESKKNQGSDCCVLNQLRIRKRKWGKWTQALCVMLTYQQKQLQSSASSSAPTIPSAIVASVNLPSEQESKPCKDDSISVLMRWMLNRVLSIGIQHLPPRILHMLWICLIEVEIGRNKKKLTSFGAPGARRRIRCICRAWFGCSNPSQLPPWCQLLAAGAMKSYCRRCWTRRINGSSAAAASKTKERGLCRGSRKTIAAKMGRGKMKRWW
jgi:hypothetical protein